MDDTKPLVPQEEQIQAPEDPGYTNEDLKAPYKQIANEEPKEEAKDDPKEEIKEEIKEPSAEEVAENAARKVLDEQEARKQADEQAKLEEETKEEPSDKEKAYLDWEKKFKAENGKQPSYLEALQFVEDQAVKGIEARQAEAAKAKEKADEEVAKAQAEEQARINTVVDDELEELYSKNKLTKIQDPNNPSDQGVVERKELFKVWAEVNAKRRAEGKPEIISATRIHEFYYTKPSAQPAGADAPVQGNSNSANVQSTQEHTYEEIHRPWSLFKRR